MKKIYGLIGYPVKHSLSAAMHNAAFNHLNYGAQYLLFEVQPEVLPGFILENIAIKDITGRIVETKDICGYNITIPHKVAAKEIIEQEFPFDPGALWDDQDFFVQFSGAINTVKRDGHVLEYYNTDPIGFLRSLAQDLKVELKNSTISVIGCGGAARAVLAAACSITQDPPLVFIWDVNPVTMKNTQDHIKVYLHKFPHLTGKINFLETQQDIADAIAKSNILVNASPIGMKESDPLPIRSDLLHKNLAVYDLVYNRQTELIKQALSLGLNACTGLGMLLYQGVAAFELWTGLSAPVDVMKKALQEAVKK